MHAALLDVAARPLLFAALVALAFAPLEAVFALRPSRVRDPSEETRREIRTDVAFATVGAVLTRAMLALVLGHALAWLERVALEPRWDLLGPPWVGRLVSLALGLFLFELGGYAYHRAAHASPVLRRLHAVHHSSTSMDFLAAFRQHPLEIVLLTAAQNLPLVLLGIPLASHALVVTFLAVNTTFVHSNLRVAIGPLSRVIATPAFHHRHHARGLATRNYASLFPFLDVLFGTYAAEGADAFGIDPRGARSFRGWLVAPFPEAVTRCNVREWLHHRGRRSPSRSSS